jgi:hypothetical protein
VEPGIAPVPGVCRRLVAGMVPVHRVSGPDHDGVAGAGDVAGADGIAEAAGAGGCVVTAGVGGQGSRVTGALPVVRTVRLMGAFWLVVVPGLIRPARRRLE